MQFLTMRFHFLSNTFLLHTRPYLLDFGQLFFLSFVLRVSDELSRLKSYRMGNDGTKDVQRHRCSPFILSADRSLIKKFKTCDDANNGRFSLSNLTFFLSQISNYFLLVRGVLSIIPTNLITLDLCRLYP